MILIFDNILLRVQKFSQNTCCVKYLDMPTILNIWTNDLQNTQLALEMPFILKFGWLVGEMSFISLFFIYENTKSFFFFFPSLLSLISFPTRSIFAIIRKDGASSRDSGVVEREGGVDGKEFLRGRGVGSEEGSLVF